MSGSAPLPLFEVGGTVVGEPDSSLRILPHQDLQRQVVVLIGIGAFAIVRAVVGL